MSYFKDVNNIINPDMENVKQAKEVSFGDFSKYEFYGFLHTIFNAIKFLIFFIIIIWIFMLLPDSFPPKHFLLSILQ